MSFTPMCLSQDEMHPPDLARIKPFDGRKWEQSIESLRPSASQHGH